VSTLKTNAKNDRLKREYLLWLNAAKQRSPATVEQVRHAIDRLEAYTRFKDFRTFNREQAMGFKQSLAETIGQRSGKPVSIATVHHILRAVQDFLIWLHGEPGHRRAILSADVAYLNLTKGDERRAHATTPKNFPTLEQHRAALLAMPSETDIGRRDRALMALLLMTGMRDAAIIGLKMKDIDLDRRYIFQDPRHARTKFRKSIDTFFLPVGDDVIAIFTDWMAFLTTEQGFGPDDPILPKTVVMPGRDHAFAAQGLGREHWANAAPVRKCFKDAFARVGMTFAKPHLVRDTLTQFGYRSGWNAEQMKALSQNIGHDKPLTTFNSYGQLTRERQGEVILNLNRQPLADIVTDMSVAALVDLVAKKLKDQG
jgi:integrase/recombinase XerD